MIGMKSIGNSCRSCINKKYHVKLERKDCIYEYYPRMCPECNKVKNIVKDINFWSKIKLMFKRKY